MAVAAQCLPIYRGLADKLAEELSGAEGPPPIVTVSGTGELLRQPVLLNSSGHPVALRMQWTNRDWGGSSELPEVDVVALYLPAVSDLAHWFRAFLTDISELDPQRVPVAPSPLNDPFLWYTPEEAVHAGRISEIEREIERLEDQRQGVEQELARASQTADATIRRAIWQAGDDLVDAVSEILEDIGFTVERMDEAKQPHEAKYEDLRLTLAALPDWAAIVEVKGYTKGIRTNDAKQVRMHKERYIAETRREPDLTLWLANPFRELDPSDRPQPDSNVDSTSEVIGAVCLLTTDLYQLWRIVRQGDRKPDEIAQQLAEARPGLWRPSSAP